MITVSGSLNDTEYGKIPLSNVMVTRKKNLFMGRTWRTLDIQTSLGILVRDPIVWVSIHRYHHQYVDSEKDPHSPIFGFWFSHMGWLFDSGYILEKYQEHKNVDDLKKQAFYRFIKMTYTLHLFVFTALVYVFGGFTYLVWVVVRICWNMFQLCVLKRLWVALVSFGEGWHNNHHAFDYSARHGLEWWQIDVGWYTIRFLEAVGLATNVKLPTEAHKLKKSVASLNKFK
ncbi:putative acyl-CoA desaturase [Helianthus annuus]|nr:putative acyl-CoA desaturase [Helianthus annuus]